jgi:hypothetical protein
MLNELPTSANYRENHNLPEFNYQGIKPFSLQSAQNKYEESKID